MKFEKDLAPSPIINSAAEWAAIKSDSRLKQWAKDLRYFSNANASKHDRDMAGRAVLIEAVHYEEVGDLMECVATEANLRLCCLDPAQMPDTVADTLASLPIHLPHLIYLKPGAWQGKEAALDAGDSEGTNEAMAQEFHKQFKDYLTDEALKHPLVFVTAAKSVRSLDISLRSVGNFDRRIAMPALDPESLASVFTREMCADLLGQSILGNAKRVGVLLQQEYPDRRRRALMQTAMRRLAWQEARPLEFTDMLNFAVHGTCEVDTVLDEDSIKIRHCIHEAGHALLAHLDSRERKPPVYCSVVKREGSQGVVVPAYDGHERLSDDPSYCDITHQIRTSLAGRAAEHLLLGAHEASACGSARDMEKAKKLATSLLAQWGHSPDITSDEQASSNLAVSPEPMSSSELDRTEVLIREFLQSQFLVALEMLRENRAYLERIVAALMKKSVLFQEDFQDLMTEC